MLPQKTAQFHSNLRWQGHALPLGNSLLGPCWPWPWGLLKSRMLLWLSFISLSWWQLLSPSVQCCCPESLKVLHDSAKTQTREEISQGLLPDWKKKRYLSLLLVPDTWVRFPSLLTSVSIENCTRLLSGKWLFPTCFVDVKSFILSVFTESPSDSVLAECSKILWLLHLSPSSRSLGQISCPFLISFRVFICSKS